MPAPDPIPAPVPSRRARAVGLRLLIASILTGVVVGAASWSLLEALDLVTRIRVDNSFLVLLLPVAGLVAGTIHHRLGGRARQGTLTILQPIRDPSRAERVPARMAPLVWALTVTSHLFGASVGREGAALQIGGSLADGVNRLMGLTARDRRILLIASLGGAFGAVFGVPWAGLVFGLELQRRQLPGTLRERFALLGLALVPTAITAFTGDLVVRLLGHGHGLDHRFDVNIDLRLASTAVLIGAATGLAALVFTTGTAAMRRLVGRLSPVPSVHPAIGGLLTLTLVALVGRDYLGLSLPLRDLALAGGLDGFEIPVWKLLLTIICVGSGFVGGEVTPLFVVGSTLGAAVAAVTGVDPGVGAAIGLSTVFGAATRTPLACAVLTIEAFGTALVVPAVITALGAQTTNGRRGLFEPPEPRIRAIPDGGSSGRGGSSPVR